MATPSDIIKRGLRSAQPTPSANAAGVLYYVTDESLLERWSGSTWESVEGYSEGARVYNSGAQSIPNTTPTNLTFDSERYDTDGIHSTSTNTDRLTCQTAGVYVIAAAVSFTGNVTGYRQVVISLNGTTPIAVEYYVPGSTGIHRMAVSTVYKLSVSDYVTVEVSQTSGGSLNVTANAAWSPEFAMQRIG